MKLITLTRGQQAIVDDDMFSYLNSMKWMAHPDTHRKDIRYYAVRTAYVDGKKFGERLHYHVIGRPRPGFIVDFINGDTLDCRRENLRIVTRRQDSQNRLEHRAGRLPGTSYDTDHKNKPWRAQAEINRKLQFIGRFDTELEAHQAYLNFLKNNS